MPTPRFKYVESKELKKSFIMKDNKENLCNRIILVLDESGSMFAQTKDVIGGVNEMIKQQRMLEPERNNEVIFNIIKFSGIVSPIMSNTLDKIENFSEKDYKPSGSTALYDAIGKTISQFKNERDVVMVIGTDGEENSSRVYGKPEIVRMIAEQREFFGWEFIYLSEDLDTFKQGNSIGFTQGTKGCTNICVNSIGSTLQSSIYNEGISQCRQKKIANFDSISKI